MHTRAGLQGSERQALPSGPIRLTAEGLPLITHAHDTSSNLCLWYMNTQVFKEVNGKLYPVGPIKLTAEGHPDLFHADTLYHTFLKLRSPSQPELVLDPKHRHPSWLGPHRVCLRVILCACVCIYVCVCVCALFAHACACVYV